VADLAEHHPSVVNTLELSKRRRIAAPVLRKVLTIMASRDLVVSAPGRGGGYRLARPPEKINVADVIAAIEGSFRFTDCTAVSNGRPKRRCAQKPVCPVIGSMCQVHRLLEQCLTGVSIAEFASGAVPETVTLNRTASRKRRKETARP
jgi:Rrf2 family protein